MSEPMNDDEHGYHLVMPFVVCASQNGPYDDQAFVAGFELGLLTARLPMLAALGERFRSITVRTDSLPQVDLIAMQHGWKVEGLDSSFGEGWSCVDLGRVDDGP